MVEENGTIIMISCPSNPVRNFKKEMRFVCFPVIGPMVIGQEQQPEIQWALGNFGRLEIFTKCYFQHYVMIHTIHAIVNINW